MGDDLKNTKQPVSFDWDMHYTCNYRCPYCWCFGKWQQMAEQNKYPALDKILKVWENIYQQHGCAQVGLIGGEPLIYPNIVQLVKGICVFHKVAITTNLSVEVDDFISQIDPSGVYVGGSFHPAFADFNKFLKRAIQLKDKGFGNIISYVAYPPQLKRLPYYAEEFRQQGFLLSVLTFWGRYNDISYPQGYTNEERAAIAPYLGIREGEKFQLEPKVVKGRMCCAGQRHATIKADGTVYRCGGSHSQVIGNFFQDDFRLLDKPLVCESETCPCNEWAGLIQDQEIVSVPAQI
jgi:MoaA/NifB/PqqE/SkfB family radical SAM enzyme